MDIDLGKRSAEDLVGLLLAESELAEQCTKNISNIREELFTRAAVGKPLEVHKVDALGGELGATIVVKKYMRKGRLGYDEDQVVRLLRGSPLEVALTKTETVTTLDREAFEEQYEGDEKLRETLGRFVRMGPDKEVAEIRGISDWLKLRGVQ